MYCNPQVDNPLLKMKFKNPSIRIGTHSRPRGISLPLPRKNAAYTRPPSVWRIPAIWSAGIYRTPSLEAIHVVPQKKHTMPRANKALKRVPLF
jgi:hypothetical protein